MSVIVEKNLIPESNKTKSFGTYSKNQTKPFYIGTKEVNMAINMNKFIGCPASKIIVIGESYCVFTRRKVDKCNSLKIS